MRMLEIIAYIEVNREGEAQQVKHGCDFRFVK
jgi:hypothetical protein